MPAVIKKFHRCFVRTLNIIVYDPAVKMGITTHYPVSPVVINGCKSYENPIFLFFTRLTFLQLRLPPPFLVTATLPKVVDFQRMFYIGW
jgi:hypothetical protein